MVYHPNTQVCPPSLFPSLLYVHYYDQSHRQMKGNYPIFLLYTQVDIVLNLKMNVFNVAPKGLMFNQCLASVSFEQVNSI